MRNKNMNVSDQYMEKIILTKGFDRKHIQILIQGTPSHIHLWNVLQLHTDHVCFKDNPIGQNHTGAEQKPWPCEMGRLELAPSMKPKDGKSSHSALPPVKIQGFAIFWNLSLHLASSWLQASLSNRAVGIAPLACCTIWANFPISWWITSLDTTELFGESRKGLQSEN